MNAVNFEKRGKLSDHVNCPITGECICLCKCPNHKKILTCILLFVLSVFFSLPSAFGQEIAYTYKVVNQSGLQDLTNKGDLLAEVFGADSHGVLIARKTNLQPIEFRFVGANDDTQVRRINNHGDVVGSSLNAAHNRETGWVRLKNGTISPVDVPGSDGTIPSALSDQLDICGQFYNPFAHPLDSGFTRFHGFCRTKQGVFKTLDLPLDHAVTIITGISRNGKKIGNYFTYDPITNETGQWHAFLLDNGNYLSLERPGAAWSYVSDINNDDTVLYEDNVDIFLLDDGIYFKISQPVADPGFTLGQVDVNGFNDKLEIVGSYSQIQLGCNPLSCQRKTTSFVATPK